MDTCLNVLLDEEHYDTILSMPGVQGCPYYCHDCDVGYRNIEDHRTACPYRCSFCLADTPCAPDGTFVHCSECKGFFKSMACYQRHLKPYSDKTDVAVCQLMETTGRPKIINATFRSSLYRKGRKFYNCTFLSTSNAVRKTAFTSPTGVSLIEGVSIGIVCPSTNPVLIAKPWDPVDTYSEVPTP